jgi:N-acetylneuraminate synthase
MAETPILSLRGRSIGPGQPTYVIGEIGINHNGDLDTALRLMRVASDAGCDCVKFQKRTPELCVPNNMRDVKRDTPWGIITYLEYRERVEFGREEYRAIDERARELGLDWTASAWDLPSLEFLEQFDVPFHKIPSALLTNDDLVRAFGQTERPIVLSTGMSTMEEVEHAVGLLDRSRLILMHCTSTYPCPPEELNLLLIPALTRRFGVPVGYSGHEVGLQTSLAAVCLGACAIERHITLDRSMWGSDQAASVEPPGLSRLVRDIRVVEAALGDGIKRVYPSEAKVRQRLRGY